ncbi:MAG: hypothetical protein R3C05_25555 [Pirellulaceae bacterium]
MNPGQTKWREEFAHTLLANGKQREAVAQLERCILQDPTNDRYQNLASQFRAADVGP